MAPNGKPKGKAKTKVVVRETVVVKPSTNGNTRPTNRNRRRRNRSSRIQGAILSKCAQDYYASLNDPWTGPQACIPSFPSLPSQRYRSLARGTFSSNASGRGFICVNPYEMSCSSSGVVSDPHLAIFTNTSAAATTWDFAAGDAMAFPPNTTGYPHSSGVPNVNITGYGQYRLVSCGIKIRYMGPLLNRGGRYVSLRVADDSHIGWTAAQLGVLGFNTIASLRGANYGCISEDWISLVYTPVQNESLCFTDLKYCVLSTGGQEPAVNESHRYQQNGCVSLGILIDTVTASLPFEFEISSNFELVGNLATAMTQSDGADPVGMARAAEAVQRQSNQSSLFGDLWEGSRPYVVSAGSRLTGFAAEMGTAFVAAKATEYMRPRIPRTASMYS